MSDRCSTATMEHLVYDAFEAWDAYIAGFLPEEQPLSQEEFVWRYLASHKFELTAALMNLGWRADEADDASE